MILKRLVIVVQAKKGAFSNKELTQEKFDSQKPNQKHLPINQLANHVTK